MRRYIHARAVCHSRVTVVRESDNNEATSLFGKSAEVPKLDDVSLTRIDVAEIAERAIQQQNLAVNGLSCADAIVQRDLHTGAGTLRRPMLARVIDKDASHHLRRHREEMRAVLPRDTLRANQADICLVDERRGLQSMVATLAPQIRRCSPPQFAIHDGDQVFAGLHVSLSPRLEQLTHVAGSGWHSKSLILWKIRVFYTLPFPDR